jgi:hypothetical protein
MRRPSARGAITHLLAVLLLGTQLFSAEKPRVLAAAAPDARAVQELLHGDKGRREAWTSVPELVVLTTVLDYGPGSLTEGFDATDETLTSEEISQLEADLTEALGILSGGAFKSFSSIRRESVKPGRTVKILRRGQIVVARYRGVRARANTIGYGGRTARADGRITAATIILDSDFDRADALRRLLRTHELGHALGYNHVESLVSVMNPRIGPEVSDFDRSAARMAFARPESSE